MINDRDLQLEFEEIAALSADDQRRRDMQDRLADDSPATRQYWQDLLVENDCYRENLARVELPDDLESRLMASANVDLLARSSRRWMIASAVAATAAMFLIIMGFGLIRQNVANSRTRTIALLAVNNHLNHLEDHGIDPGEDGKDELEATLSEQVGFRVKVPELAHDLELTGGRKCKLGTHSVAFTLWKDERGQYSLFQFQTDNFGLPSTIAPTLVHSTQPAGADHDCGAWVWTDGPYAYVLTGDPGVDLKRLSPPVPSQNQ